MKKSILALGLCAMASTASAQDIYLGGSFDLATPHSGDGHLSAGLLGGGTVWDNGQLSFAAQAEYSTAMAGSDKPDATRIRALAGFDLPGFTGIGGLGLTQYRDSAGSYSGLNMSLGFDVPLGSGPANVRLELIRDWMDDYGTDVTTTRVGYIFNF